MPSRKRRGQTAHRLALPLLSGGDKKQLVSNVWVYPLGTWKKRPVLCFY